MLTMQNVDKTVKSVCCYTTKLTSCFDLVQFNFGASINFTLWNLNTYIQ